MNCRKCSKPITLTASQKKHCNYICRACENARKHETRDARHERERAYRSASRAKTAAREKAYRAAHREEFAARKKAYHIANREKLNTKKRAYNAAHREELAVKRRANYAAHPEKSAKSTQAYKKANLAKGRAWSNNRRIRKIGNGGSHTVAEWTALCDWFGNVCLRCGGAFPLSEDHVNPVIKGGLDSIGNLQPLCKPCNSVKGVRDTDYRDPVRLAAFLEQL